ncbi:hypothetical protein ACFL2V_00005, partial [Pseudomonadota bacterium]
ASITKEKETASESLANLPAKAAKQVGVIISNYNKMISELEALSVEDESSKKKTSSPNSDVLTLTQGDL